MTTMTQQRQQPAREAGSKRSEAQPILHQRGKEIQPFGALTRYPLGLGDEVRQASVQALNQLLSDTMVLRDLYKKHHWQVSGPTFYQLHLLLDKHYEEQVELVDALAERVQTLGGVAVAMAHDVAEMTRIERPPRVPRRGPRPALSPPRRARGHPDRGAEGGEDVRRKGDPGTSDLLVSEVVRSNEMQVWFLAEHLVDTPLIHARDGKEARGAVTPSAAAGSSAPRSGE